MTIPSLLQHIPKPEILDLHGRFVPIDLSASNPELEDLQTSAAFEEYINKYLKTRSAVSAYGGYKEKRNLYRRSDLFDEEDGVRDIHIGLDIWAPAGTAVLSPLTGTVHSFDYNSGLGNYGPTIILEHKIENLTFYTLYGHLSAESIEELEIGDIFGSGQKLATLGNASVNGDYAPHLHFQIIIDVEDYEGDYPGVCAVKDLPFYEKNCPDPNLLLKLN